MIITPTGEKITTYGTADFSAVSLSLPVNDAGSAASGSAAIIGTYTAQAEYTELQAFADDAKKSNTISFTVKESSLQPASDGNMNNAFRVLFDTKGGSYVSPMTYLSYGDMISQPATPTREGYTFSGWYTDSACTKAWNFAHTIPGDMALYAKWIEEGSSKSVPTTKPTTQQPSAAQTAEPTTIQASVSPSPAPAGTTAAQPTLTQAPTPLAGLLSGLVLQHSSSGDGTNPLFFPSTIYKHSHLIMQYVETKGSITRQETVELLHLSESQAYRLLKKMVSEDKLTLSGRGRGAKYLPNITGK